MVRPCVLPRRHGWDLPKVTALSCSSPHGRHGPGPINHSLGWCWASTALPGPCAAVGSSWPQERPSAC